MARIVYRRTGGEIVEKLIGLLVIFSLGFGFYLLMKRQKKADQEDSKPYSEEEE